MKPSSSPTRSPSHSIDPTQYLTLLLSRWRICDRSLLRHFYIFPFSFYLFFPFNVSLSLYLIIFLCFHIFFYPFIFLSFLPFYRFIFLWFQSLYKRVCSSVRPSVILSVTLPLFDLLKATYADFFMPCIRPCYLSSFFMFAEDRNKTKTLNDSLACDEKSVSIGISFLSPPFLTLQVSLTM